MKECLDLRADLLIGRGKDAESAVGGLREEIQGLRKKAEENSEKIEAVEKEVAADEQPDSAAPSKATNSHGEPQPPAEN